MKHKREYFEWDKYTWCRSLNLWDKGLNKVVPKYGLEIGARTGSLSELLICHYGLRMVASDQNTMTDEMKEKLKKWSDCDMLTYSEEDAKKLKFLDNTFDLVVFKSVMGTVGAFGHDNDQEKMMIEIFRVLKNGGILLFAENLNGNLLHKYFRKKYSPWAYYWNYPDLYRFKSMLHNFSEIKYCTSGVFAAFVKDRYLIKSCVSDIDYLFEKCIPENWRYLIYGYAIK